MEIEFKMPDLATTGSEIKVLRWLVAPGETVRRGQALLEVETDKAAMEVESIASGTLRTACVAVGDAIAAGQMIAVIATAEPSPRSVAPAPASAAANPPAAAAPPSGGKPSGGMFAKNRAAAKPVSPADEGIPLTPTQRIVARRMAESKQNAPHFYLQASLNAEPMARRRAAASGPKPAWDAFFAQAAARALKKFERMGRRFVSDQLRPAGTSDIGVAVDHEGELYVVAVSDPAARTVEEISNELREKVAKVRESAADARGLKPAAMTITNLGASRVETFTAIVNPPEAAILAIGRVAPAAVATDAGIIAQQRVTITLSVDHRVVNGRYAADFLSEIVRELETL